MRKYTVADIMKLKPCYKIQQIEQLWDGREALSLAEICRLDIGLTDIIWVVSRILHKRAIRLFSCDCAEHVLQLYEREHPDDARPRECIDVARKYANGNANWEELAAANTAAMAESRFERRAAGWAVARAAAWAAACAAADAAAYDAVRAAAWAVACDAVGNAARAAEQKWQLGRLIEYVTEAEENSLKGRAND